MRKRIHHLARTKGLKGKALIEGNGYSFFKINNIAYKSYKIALWVFILLIGITPSRRGINIQKLDWL